jgi:hypothetical protein
VCLKEVHELVLNKVNQVVYLLKSVLFMCANFLVKSIYFQIQTPVHFHSYFISVCVFCQSKILNHLTSFA